MRESSTQKTGYTLSQRDHSDDRLEDRIRLRLAAQSALLGEITPRLFAVTVGIADARTVMLAAYYDGPVGEKEWEEMSSVSLEITAYLGSVQRGGELIHAGGGYASVHDMHVDVPTMLDVWVFRRSSDHT